MMRNFNIRYIFIGVLLMVLVGVIIRKHNSKITDSTTDFDSFDARMTKVDLSSEESKIAYAFGLKNSERIKAGYSMFGIDTLQLTNFIRGVHDGFSNGKDPHMRAYFEGILIGDLISNGMIGEINHKVFGDDSTKTISLPKFMAGFVSATLGKGSLMTVDSATQLAQELIKSVFENNIKEGETFLIENAQKPGVKVLASGVQYKVIKEGYGSIPSETSLIKVHYEGRTLKGKVFDSSYKRGRPAEMRANQYIKGWTDVLVHMPVGSIWEVYIPQELAYGEREQGDIKPFSMLIFKIELLDVK